MQIIEIFYVFLHSNSNLKDYRKLYQYITDRMLPDKMNYVFLDEIQSVDTIR